MLNLHRRLWTTAGLAFMLIAVSFSTGAILHAEGERIPVQSHDFTDVPYPTKEFMEPFINAFYHQGVTTGCSQVPLMYCPEANLTRAEMAVFMGRALGYLQAETDGISAEAYFKQTTSGATYHGVVGTSVDGRGVSGASSSGMGVYGESTSGTGVRGTSTNGFGVHATSTNFTAVEAASTGGYAVYANSTNNWAVYGLSDNASGIFAQGAGDDLTDTLYDMYLGGGWGELFGNNIVLYSNGHVIADLDHNNNSGHFFIVRNGTDNNVFYVDESGNATAVSTLSGNTATGQAVIGTASTSGTGVYGTSVDGFGVRGISTNAHGVWGESTAGVGVLGTSPVIGVMGNSTDGYGVSGSSDTSTGVRGQSEEHYGVYGSSINGVGVGAFSTTDYGMSGYSADSYGVYASSTNASGLFAQGGTNSSLDSIFDIDLGGSLGEIFASTILLYSNQNVYIDLDNDDTSTNALIVRDGDNNTILMMSENGTLTVDDLNVTGTKNNIVDTVHYGTRELYAVESTEYWFEDMGRAKLRNGSVTIEFDAVFAETVNLHEEYEVFLTPIGQSVLLYVTDMTATSFTVRADNAPDIEFSYRIVAKRLGYEDVRLEEVENE